MTVQNETRWLLETIIDEWPGTGSLGGDAPPDYLILRDRDDGVNYYADADADDPDAPDGYEGVRETTTSHDGFATVGISEGAVTREFYGNKPQYDVTTTLDVRVAEKSVWENGTAESSAAHKTLVAFIQRAINTQLTYPEVDGVGDRDALQISSGETVTVADGEERRDSTLSVEDGGTLTVEEGGTHVLYGEDIGGIVYLDAAITDEDNLESADQDAYQTTFTVRLRGREDTP